MIRIKQEKVHKAWALMSQTEEGSFIMADSFHTKDSLKTWATAQGYNMNVWKVVRIEFKTVSTRYRDIFETVKR